MSYYFSSYSYSSSMENGKTKRESAKGIAKSSNGSEEFFVFDKENDKVLKDMKGSRKSNKENFDVEENKKKMKKTEKEVYDILVKSYPNINEKHFIEFLNSPEYKKIANDKSKSETEKVDKKQKAGYLTLPSKSRFA